MRPALDADGIWCSSAAGFGGPGLIAGSAERLNGRRAAGTSMQRGLGRSAAGARPAGIGWSYGGLAVLLAGLGLSACVNTGQIVNLTEGRPGTTVAFESIDGAPPAVFQKLVDSLKEHAGTHQLSIVPAAQASYRLHGYLATHGEDGSRSIAWVWDVYDGDQRRVFRVSGEEKADKGGSFWDAADDAILHRIARTGMQQLAILSARPAVDVASASPRAQRAASALGWLDDWTPEASGIFRILRRASAPPPPEIAEDASRPLPLDEIPSPEGRPAPSGETSGRTFAFAHVD